MNTDYEETSPSDSRFDQLVDGELNEQQRRELLASLDDQPGGWRRCALAFLESQCWKQTLGAVGQWQRAPQTQPVTHRPPASRTRWSRHAGALLAMAACFMAAFYLGSWYLGTGRDRSLAPSGLNREVAVTTEPVQKEITTTAPQVATKKPEPSEPWRMVTVAAPTGSTLQVPAVERDRLDPDWLAKLPSAIPEDVIQALNRTGHQVEQRRELAPVRLEDGRQMVVPVDQVNVHYVGNGTY